jgi:hypothetical protein
MRTSEWQKPRTMPSKGQTARVSARGDDYHRTGTVVYVSQGRVWLNFADEREGVYSCSEIEVRRA